MREVVKHEHYRELCAAASIGQATPEELFELEQHASECAECGEAYFDYLNLAAKQFAAADKNPSLSPGEVQELLDSQLFTRRFFERAEREGIRFSSDVGQEARKLAPVTHPSAVRFWTGTSTRAIAAIVVFGFVLGVGYFLGRTRSSAQSKRGKAGAIAPPAIALDGRVAELASANRDLQAEMDHLRLELRTATDQLRSSETNLNSTAGDRRKLEADRDALETELKDVQNTLVQSRAAAVGAQQEAAQQRDHAGDVEGTLLADQVKIQDLTQELGEKSALLDQERQLLALGHDVSDLMGARNLHIVDVVDTDPKGKTRPAFGRIFFTEGKSLVFYAYDLNDARTQKTNYQYGVWAKKEGDDKQVQRLGIFYSDDKTQRRWVFKCNDPKLLTEIDSVFVTLEPADGDLSRPNGTNLMYAYLRGQPNHP
jgi:hypothetical protein